MKFIFYYSELKCIKLKNKKANNTKEIHIIVLNKCEIDYIKCHDGLEATLVSMKNCEKPTVGNLKKKRPKRSPKIAKTSKNNITLKSRRNKIPLKSNKIDYSKLYFGPQRRDISEDIVDEEEEGSGNLSGEVVEELNVSVKGNLGGGDGEMMSFKVEGGDDKFLEEQEFNDGNIDDEVSIDDGSDDEASDDVSEMNVSLHIKQDLKDSNEEEPEVIAGSDETKLEDITDPKTQDLPPGPGQVGTSVEDDGNDIEIQNAEVEDSTESDDVNKEVETPETPDSSDSDVNTQDIENGDCPTECPARDVMVCARCRAGVYRTFLSVCHLRQFSCNHPEKKLELVARRPCVLSAPFLAGMKTKGRQKDPNDEDVVLKYIRCREKGNTNDPKCKFAKVDKPRLRRKI
ncbi:PREDICTED: uncharacterized protein LOC106105843 [Papilio polytes]|uniref:uncharacterized protein LOC106105843 n=1 Tax=Papilio polytes TaxID=76194 RepID=UPI000676A3A4|nr:PREDICTED: uncharacterized protein LOC106105843 [Papilio polytes]